MRNVAANNRTNSPTKGAKQRRNRPAAARSNFIGEEHGVGRSISLRPTLPKFIPPMQARFVRELPAGPDWLYELKFDGYRVEAIKRGESVRLISRNAKNLTTDFPAVALALSTIKAKDAVLDGEVVAVDEQGRPSFQALQHRSALAAGHQLVYYAFDLLHLDGRDLTALSLQERRRALEKVLRGSSVLFSAELKGDLDQIVEGVKRLDLEGVVAKRRDSKYEPANRSGAWLKVQFKRQQEFVIGGYKPEGDSFSSIAVGYYENGKLMFAGKVRGGFNPHSRRELLKAMQPLHLPRPSRSQPSSRPTSVLRPPTSGCPCPFANLPTSKTGHWGEGMTAEQMSEIQWLKPKLVAQVRFTEWTRDAHLRHADYLGLRSDKAAEDVIREQASVG